jgi:hypothetical protein
MGVKYGEQRPWSNHWYDVQQELRAVEAACQPGANRDNQSLKRSFETFFTVCFHFGDWLWEDQSTGLTKRQVENFIDSDPALRVCEGLANTKKHRTRRKMNAMTVVIAEVHYDRTGSRAIVEWTEMQRSGSEDALDLARRCVVAWERYLKANGLQSPI